MRQQPSENAFEFLHPIQQNICLQHDIETHEVVPHAHCDALKTYQNLLGLKTLLRGLKTPLDQIMKIKNPVSLNDALNVLTNEFQQEASNRAPYFGNTQTTPISKLTTRLVAVRPNNNRNGPQNGSCQRNPNFPNNNFNNGNNNGGSFANNNRNNNGGSFVNRNTANSPNPQNRQNFNAQNSSNNRFTSNPQNRAQPHTLHKAEIQKQIQSMLDQGIIRPSYSPWSSPLWVVPKKLDASGKPKWRVVIDYRKLNAKTVGDKYPLPNIGDLLDKIGRCNYFTTLDLASGFHQIEKGP
nr:PREDICTED: transcription initiation factor TFIID subunit 1-like [Bemisia tabaci]